MIGYITGKIKSLKPGRVLIETGGLGYLLNISLTTFEKISGKENTELFTHLHVKEDALDLFGFYSEKEKNVFLLLISVNGIGPRLALNMLSGISANELTLAIIEGNISRIVSVPGVGKKTAERIIIELRDKMSVIGETDVEGTTIHGGIREDALAALISLGYNKKSAEQTVRKIMEENPAATLEEIIKRSLSNLSR